jgi:hypothetical protein
MVDGLVLRSYDYLMNSTFDRINNGKHFDEKFKPYSEVFIKKIVSYFENKEEYEKCKILTDFINIRFNHDKNYNKL